MFSLFKNKTRQLKEVIKFQKEYIEALELNRSLRIMREKLLKQEIEQLKINTARTNED